jgi:beta-lactamase regulating signal transducer with metallopeptidase domain
MALLLDIFLSDESAKAVCWTLVHSVWEGTLAALAAGVIILATRKRPAALRYNLLTLVMAGFVFLAGATLFYELSTGDPRITADPVIPAFTAVTTAQPQIQHHVTVTQTTPVYNTLIPVISDYLNTHAVLITLLWLICLLAQLLRLSGGLYRIHRIRRDSILPFSDVWTHRLDTLARQLGIRRTVTLLQSKLVRTPAAFGFLKPSILVPLGFLAQLPPHQVETILLHELAHIRRNDYVTNLLLHLTEALFFFNPGIRWIGTLIRREREACCDDMVLAGTADRNNYFEALVAFTQLAVDGRIGNGRPAYMLPLGGSRKTDLLWRIKRMLEKENQKLHLLEKTVLSLALFALVSFSLIKPRQQSGTWITPAAAVPTTGAPTVEVPTVAAPTAAVQAQLAAAAQAQLAAAQAVKQIAESAMTPVAPIAAIPPVPAIAVPVPPVPPVPAVRPDTAPQKFAFQTLSHTSRTENGSQAYKATAQSNDGHSYEIRKHNDEILEFKIDGQLISQKDYPRYLPVFAEFAADASECARGYVAPAEPLTGAPADPVAVSPADPVGVPPTDPVAVPPMDPAGSGVTDQPQDRTPRSKRPPTLAYPLVFTNNPDIDILHIATDLVNTHLITDVKQYSFNLTPSIFLVNGVPVPENIARRFREKYVPGPGYDYEYSQYWNSRGSGSHCIVHTPNRTANLTNHY